jgi:hypothetical protein
MAACNSKLSHPLGLLQLSLSTKPVMMNGKRKLSQELKDSKADMCTFNLGQALDTPCQIRKFASGHVGSHTTGNAQASVQMFTNKRFSAYQLVHFRTHCIPK